MPVILKKKPDIRLQPDIRIRLFLQPDNPESGSGLKITIRYSPIICNNQTKHNFNSRNVGS